MGPSHFDAHFHHERQAHYLERLKGLSTQEAHDYRLLFDELAEKKALTQQALQLANQENDLKQHFSGHRLSQELVTLIGDLVDARNSEDRELTHQLLHCLEDVNIAVNAWINQLCLPRSRFLYTRQQILRHRAKHSLLN